jgi:hypothetical protein
MRSAFTLAILAATISAQAADLPYDPALEARQRTVIGLYVRTRQCLGDAARAIMRQGVKEERIVKHFMVSMCGDPFYGYLRRDGMPEEQARNTLVEMTETALYEDVLHQPRPRPGQ